MSLDAAQLTDAAQSVTASMSEWHDIVAGLPRSIESQGVAAEAYANALARRRGTLDDLAGGLDDASAFLRATADWIARSRRALAGTLASCLGSREALTLRSAGWPGPITTILAAADIGASVLAMVAHCLDDGWQVRDRYTSILAEDGRWIPALLRRSGPATASTCADPRLPPDFRFDARVGRPISSSRQDWTVASARSSVRTRQRRQRRDSLSRPAPRLLHPPQACVFHPYQRTCSDFVTGRAKRIFPANRARCADHITALQWPHGDAVRGQLQPVRPALLL